MSALKARVENGRLRLDEPTDLPDGTEVELVIVGDDDLSEEERARLHASLDRALDDEDADRVVDADAFLAEVRAET
jgi:predicted DNA-binding antitoxin AbrB/MazE fold protein